MNTEIICSCGCTEREGYEGFGCYNPLCAEDAEAIADAIREAEEHTARCGDYKDYASQHYEALATALQDHPEILDDIPEGDACPRTYLDWLKGVTQ